jgi:hypothetical protein
MAFGGLSFIIEVNSDNEAGGACIAYIKVVKRILYKENKRASEIKGTARLSGHFLASQCFDKIFRDGIQGRCATCQSFWYGVL